MSIPAPGADESENEFLTRAIEDEGLKAMFPNEKQRIAILRGQLWKRDHAADREGTGSPPNLQAKDGGEACDDGFAELMTDPGLTERYPDFWQRRYIAASACNQRRREVEAAAAAARGCQPWEGD